jgi:O-antigen ligase
MKRVKKMNFLDDALYYLFCLYIIVLPLIPGKTVSGDIIFAIVMLLYVFKIIMSDKNRRKFIEGFKDFFQDYLSIFMAILFLIMMVSVSYAFDKKLALSESARFLTYIVMYFIIKYDCNEDRYIKGILNSYVFTCLLLCLFGIYQYLTGYGLAKKFTTYSYTSMRIAATMDNPNNLGAFLILALFPLIMITIYEKNKIKKVIYAVISALVLTNIILVDSRNALVGIGIGCVVLIIAFSWRLIFIIGPAALIALFTPRIRHRLMDIANASQDESRIKLWKTALKMIKDHPIRGVGNGNYVSLYDAYVKKYPELKYPWFTHYPCHNSYLKVESELGIFGGISFIAILAFAFLRVKEAAFSAKDNFYKYFYTGFMASMVAFYFMNLSDNLFFTPKTTAYFWILLATSQAVMYNKSKRSIL